MKKVVFLGDTLINDEPLGIQRYLYEILQQIDKSEPEFECEMLVPAYVDCKITFKNIRIVRQGNIKNAFLWRQIVFPSYLKRNNAVGVDATLGLAVLGTDIVCLHDCIHEKYKEDFVGFKRKLRRLSYIFRAKIVVKKAKKIITLSQNSKNELMEIYKLPADKIEIVNCSWQHFSRIKANYDILEKLNLKEKEYLFSLGSILPHKNIKWVIEVARQNADSVFVLAGTNRLGSGLDDAIPSNVVFTGYLMDDEIKALMEKCKIFIHPAFAEGFGMPPLEALSCGADILISNASCLPEIYDESASYLEPTNYEGVEIDKMVGDISKEDKMSVLNKYSWEKSAKKMVEIITPLLRD